MNVGFQLISIANLISVDLLLLPLYQSRYSAVNLWNCIHFLNQVFRKFDLYILLTSQIGRQSLLTTTKWVVLKFSQTSSIPFILWHLYRLVTFPLLIHAILPTPQKKDCCILNKMLVCTYCGPSTKCTMTLKPLKCECRLAIDEYCKSNFCRFVVTHPLPKPLQCS